MESDDFLQLDGQKIALVLEEKDNVAVVLADIAQGEQCCIRGLADEYMLEATENVPFGHKIALQKLSKDAPIYKYGEEIGVASVEIAQGGWIHTHNLYCARGM